MKTFVALIAVLALTATAYGQVTVGVDDQGNGTAIVQITAVGPGLPIEGVALIVDATAGATNNMIVGVAKPASPLFDVYIDYAHDNSGEKVDVTGEPNLPAGVVLISVAELYVLDANSESLPMHLAIIDLDGEGDICMSTDLLDGGMVAADGSAAGVIFANDLGGCGDEAGRYAIAEDCYTGPDHAEWVAVGKPASWCSPLQCYGDADGMDQQIGHCAFDIADNDLEILIYGYKKFYSGDPLVDPWIAADFDHAAETIGHGTFRVSDNDLHVLMTYYKTRQIPRDCNP